MFYKGYLFSTPAAPLPGQDVVWTLAGHFQALMDSSNTIPNIAALSARHNIFGWFAQITVIN